MDSKLSQLYVPRTFSRYSSLYKKYNPISTHKQQVCRCQIQGISSNNQESTNRFLVHMVKEGETLNSISKLYGVPACDIAAVNEKIADFELFFEGQLLNIPSSITTLVRKGKGETKFISCGRDSVVGLYSRFLNMKNSTVASVLHLSYAKNTSCGYFLVVVPVIAFCIRCIMGALNSRLFKDLEPRDSEQRCHHGTKQMRWETALLDLRDPSEDDELDIRPGPEINQQFTKDEDEIESNHISHHTYGKLEEDYQKFLSECGISNCGYWRGGSSK